MTTKPPPAAESAREILAYLGTLDPTELMGIIGMALGSLRDIGLDSAISDRQFRDQAYVNVEATLAAASELAHKIGFDYAAVDDFAKFFNQKLGHQS